MRLLLLLAAASWAGPKAAPPVPAVEHALFSCAAPKGWGQDRRPEGIVFWGPKAEGLDARIVVVLVEKDETAPDPAGYMKRMTKPSVVPLAGFKKGPVKDAAVAGRKALALDADSVDFADAQSIAPKQVKMKERHIAVPAAKGYYLLEYYSPASIDKKSRAAFQAVVASFTPKT